MSQTAARPAATPGVIHRIRLHAHALSPSLQRLAEHVVTHAETVMHQTITELAGSAGVGEATITRLCHKLEFAGFHAFKIALASDVAGRDPARPPIPATWPGRPRRSSNRPAAPSKTPDASSTRRCWTTSPPRSPARHAST